MHFLSRPKSSNESSEHIIHIRENKLTGSNSSDNDETGGENDPLDGVQVPGEFDERVFDAAYKSIRYMVWSETWQRYMQWRRNSGNEVVGD